MNKTLLSLAILKVNWDYLKRDYLENFIPFLATLIEKRGYQNIEVREICVDFKDEFGITIPHHPMITILTRAKKRGLIFQRKHRYYPNKKKIDEYSFRTRSIEQEEQIERIINSFISYCKNSHNIAITQSDAEKAFIAYLKRYDLKIMFSAQELTMLPAIQPSSREIVFLIHGFIKKSYEENKENFDKIKNIAIGHLLSFPIFYEEFGRFQGKLKSLDLYLDTGFIIKSMGLEGEERKFTCIELLQSLAEQKVNLYLLPHTHNEIMYILDDCLRWINSPQYDPRKASPALRYLQDNNCKTSDVERLIVNFGTWLNENKIRIKDPMKPDEEKHFQIDEDQLYQMIIDIYKESSPLFNEFQKERTIRNDVKSINYIHRYRRGRRPRLLKDAGSVLITTNASLAFASRKYEMDESADKLLIPLCITDTFIGTLIWLQSPAKISEVNEKKIIADCYAALRPSDALLRKYLNEIERLKREAKINEEEYYLLRTHRISLNLLEELTLGNPDNFTDRTPEEILDEIRKSIRREEEKKYLEEKESHDGTKAELKQSYVERKSLQRTVDQVEVHSRKITKVISATLGAFLILSAIICVSDSILNWSRGNMKIVLKIGAIGLALLSIVFGFNIKNARAPLDRFINNFIKKKFFGIK